MRRPDEPEKIGIMLAIIVVIAGILVLSFAYHYIENKTALAYNKYSVNIAEGRFAGCAVSSTCSNSLSKWYLQKRPMYYSKYKKDSEEYWHSYCTLIPHKCSG